jgi:hypothetical protein
LNEIEAQVKAQAEFIIASASVVDQRANSNLTTFQAAEVSPPEVPPRNHPQQVTTSPAWIPPSTENPTWLSTGNNIASRRPILPGLAKK